MTDREQIPAFLRGDREQKLPATRREGGNSQRDPDELIRGIEQQVSTVSHSTRRDNGAQSATGILDVFKRAADMIRDVHKLHESQAETLAQHIENIGKDFHDLCKQAAEQVRHMRVTPQEMATRTADELVMIGQTEQERHQLILQGMNSINSTVRTMSDRNERAVDDAIGELHTSVEETTKGQ